MKYADSRSVSVVYVVGTQVLKAPLSLHRAINVVRGGIDSDISIDYAFRVVDRFGGFCRRLPDGGFRVFVAGHQVA